MPYFTEPEECLDAIYNLINSNRAALGVKFVGYADETLLPKYPAVVVSYNVPVERELGPTQTFSLNWQVSLTIYHARLSASHRTRTKEDMQIAAAIREKLHEDYKLGGGVIFGYVTNERPGLAADDRGQANIATMLIWEGQSRAAM